MKIFNFLSRNKTNKLSQFKKAAPFIQELFSPANKYRGQQYFRLLAVNLCKHTNAKKVIIGSYNQIQHRVNTLIISSKSVEEENFSFSVDQLPCEGLITKTTCCYTHHAHTHFSNVNLLTDKEEGFIGIPIYNSNNEVNGLLMATFEKTIEKDSSAIEALLQLYIPRISTEIEHTNAIEALKTKNQELSQLHDQLQEKNKQLDLSIIELNKTRAKAEENNQLKTAFLANMSHEIRTPMNAIIGFAEILRSDSLDAEEREEYIDIININGLQLLKVMDNLMDISKLQTNLVDEKPKKIRLNVLLEKMWHHYMKEINLLHKPVDLFLEKGLNDNNDLILTRSEGLVKILNHLLDNALKFTSKGWVKFGYSASDNELEFFVKDTGIGLPLGSENIIFEMFRQVKDKNRQFGGNGLGLAICKKYIESSGGRIWFEKNNEFATCFRFTIPFSKELPLNHKIVNTNKLSII